MPTTTYTPSHPIIFLCDFANQGMEVPTYDPGSVASANSSCVSIRTIADVDGQVTIMLEPRLPNEAKSGVEVFQGTVETPSKRVAVVTPENKKLLEISLQETRARLRVVVDEEENPSKVWVAVTNA